MSSLQLKENYILANCCQPAPPDTIVGYFSHDGFLKVHRKDCTNLKKAEEDRLVALNWPDVTAPEEFEPEFDYSQLDDIDFAILRHHLDFGIDYSLKVARERNVSKEIAFDRHRKLRDIGLLERVEPSMVQYRKGVVKHKWIKHRNHTYYGLTKKGELYLDYFEKNQ